MALHPTRRSILGGATVWLGSEPQALIVIIIADVWKTAPFVALLLLAGLTLVQPVRAEHPEPSRRALPNVVALYWDLSAVPAKANTEAVPHRGAATNVHHPNPHPRPLRPPTRRAQRGGGTPGPPPPHQSVTEPQGVCAASGERPVGGLGAHAPRAVRSRGTNRNRLWRDPGAAAVSRRHPICRGLTRLNGSWVIA